jgi:hypothetical protein
MATIIDSLIVQLGLDTKNVESKAPGVRKQLSDLEKDAKKTKDTTDDLGKSLKQTGAQLGAFLAVLGGTVAVRSFVKDAIDTNTQLYFLSRNLEMNTQKLFAFGAAAQEIGGSKGTIQNFMRTIAGMPGELLIGRMPQLLPLFARLGINFRQPFDQIMLDLSKRFAGMDRKVAFSFGTASGIPDDVMNLLLQGPGAVQSAIGRTAGFGPTGKEAESAARMKRQFTDLELQIVKIGYDLLYKATPALEKFLGVLQAIGAWAQRHEKIVAMIAAVATGLAGIAALATGLGAVAMAWSALTGAIAAAWPVLTIVGIVTALAAAIGLLWDDYKVWAEGGKSYFNWGEFAAGVDATTEAFKSLAQWIENATDRYTKWLKAHGFGWAFDASEKMKQGFGGFAGAVGTDVSKIQAMNQIARAEGFYESGSKQNIPQRAHNPTDIEYGPFAIAHGATGYVLAQGGKKIATFADEMAGWAAAYALLGTSGYAGLSTEQTISRWQTGRTPGGSSPVERLMMYLHGVAGASGVPSSVSMGSGSSGTSNDNSRTTHIGTIYLQNPSGQMPMTPSMARGMDWTTLLTQQNFGLQ